MLANSQLDPDEIKECYLHNTSFIMHYKHKKEVNYMIWHIILCNRFASP